MTKGNRFSLDAASETLKLAKPSRFPLPDKTILQSNPPQNVNMTTIDRAQTDIVKAPSSQSVFCCVFLTSTRDTTTMAEVSKKSQHSPDDAKTHNPRLFVSHAAPNTRDVETFLALLYRRNLFDPKSLKQRPCVVELV